MVVTGKMPVAIPLQFGFVDVRDVASAHILAMQNPLSNGERFALSERDLWYKDIAQLLRDNGFEKAPTMRILRLCPLCGRQRSRSAAACLRCDG